MFMLSLVSRCRSAAVLVPFVALASCAGGAAGTDDQRINTALLRTLTADGTAICVDRGTYGEPLAVFRTMRTAPDPVRRMLHWSAPTPLRPGRMLSGRELVDNELRDGRSVLPELGQDGALSLNEQARLNALAHRASLVSPESGVAVRNHPAVPLAQVRWWPLNRMGGKCGPSYTVSKPVITRDIAFVTVTAAHQGNTYAFQRQGAGWATVAKWSNWLY